MDDAVAVVIAAAIASVPATVAAWNSRKNRAQMKTRNGHSAGELLDEIREDMSLMKMWTVEHMRSHEQHVTRSDEQKRDDP